MDKKLEEMMDKVFADLNKALDEVVESQKRLQNTVTEWKAIVLKKKGQ